MEASTARTHIALAIFAHNEESAIARMLESLSEQSVFEKPTFKLSLHCLPNGCSDRTADVARSVLQKLWPEDLNRIGDGVTWQVIEYAEPGKSRTWNRFVHEVLPEDCDYVFFLDGDIWFPQRDTLALVLARAIHDDHAHVVVDVPRKHLEFDRRPGLLGRMSLSATRFTRKTRRQAAIAGSLYCARAAFVRSVWMPEGLSGEDGFLKAMAITDLFTRAPDPERVVCEPSAYHVYLAYTKPLEVFRHEVRLAIGTTLNCYLCWDFFAKTDLGCDAGEYIRRRNADDPGWYKVFVREEAARRGWWKLPRASLTRQFRGLKTTNGLGMLRLLPGAVLRFLLDVPTLLRANSLIRRGEGVGFW